jgi:hypothetical protein
MDLASFAEPALSLALGIGLAAACGFRIFVPFLVMSIAAQAGYLELAQGWTWIGEWPALVMFAVATALEIAAFYVPWLDNLLDTVATPAAVVAGIVATAAVITGMSPLLTWTLAVIAGGGVAGMVQTGATVVRAMSTATTLGAGNFVVATGEWIGALIAAVLAIVAPWLALLAVLLLILWLWRRRRLPHAPASS